MKKRILLFDFFKTIWKGKYLFLACFVIFSIFQFYYFKKTYDEKIILNYTYDSTKTTSRLMPNSLNQNIYYYFLKEIFFKKKLPIPISAKWGREKKIEMVENDIYKIPKIFKNKDLIINFRSDGFVIDNKILKNILESLNEKFQIYKIQVKNELKADLENNKLKLDILSDKDKFFNTKTANDIISNFINLKFELQEFEINNQVNFNEIKIVKKEHLFLLLRNLFGSFLLALIITIFIQFREIIFFKKSK